MAAAYESQKEGEILELRFDRRAGVEIGTEPPVEGRQLADFLPDDAERGEDGLVSFIQRVVDVAAQSLQLVGIRENRPCRRELVILARLVERRDRSRQAETT